MPKRLRSEKMDQNVEHLLEYVDLTRYNTEENKYIKNILKYILDELNCAGGLQQFIKSIINGSESQECIILPRSKIIIPKQFHVSDNSRSKGFNGFVSNQMQWLSVVISRIFKYPEIKKYTKN